MREAARVAGVSVSTLRRRRDELTAAGAVIDPNGWQVPITALIAVGLVPGEGHHTDDNDTAATETPEASDAAAKDAPGGDPDDGPHAVVRVRELEQKVRELSEQLHLWQRRAEVAEARAEERARSLDVLRIANESERLALRMLTSQHAPTTTPAPADTPPAPPEDTGPTHAPAQQEAPATEQGQSRRGGFLRRLFTD